MAPSGQLIRTPTDFRATLGGCDFAIDHLLAPLPQIEPQVRHAVDMIFADLQYISADEPGMVSCYLDSIEKPLDELDALGFGIYALTTTGTMSSADGDPAKAISGWRRVHYLIVGKAACFQLQSGDATAPVHRFNARCDRAAKDLARAVAKETPLACWALPEVVRRQLERNVPWCETCCLEEAMK